MSDPSTAPPTFADGWYPDPTGGYDRRYFADGRFTKHVVSDANSEMPIVSEMPAVAAARGDGQFDLLVQIAQHTRATARVAIAFAVLNVIGFIILAAAYDPQ